jgi:three-Cys-motif partner protein
MHVSRNVEVLPAQDFNLCLPSLLSVVPVDCFIFAFLDPDGLQLNWSTVSAIGNRRYRELLINFSNGVVRCAQLTRTNRKLRETMKAFMGSDDEWWRYTSEEILETYKTNLRSLGSGFKHVLELPVKNQTQTIVYNLLFATNNDTAVKILRDRMSHLEGLTTEHLRVLFLREQGEDIEDLVPFLGSPRRTERPEPDAFQTQLLRYARE